MPESPDLDRAREAAARLLVEKGNDYEEPIDAAEDIARLILNQRAEEAELAAEFVRESEFPGSIPLNDRAADLRRQARGAK